MNPRKLIHSVFLVIILLCFYVAVGYFSHEEHYSPRKAVSLMIDCTAELRKRIATQLINETKLLPASEKDCAGVSGKIQVSAEGVITIDMPMYDSQLIFRPNIEAGSVKWMCTGYPDKHLPNACSLRQ